MDINSADWHTIWIMVLGGLILALILYAIKSWHKLMERMDSQDDDLNYLHQLMAREFGGNGGGLRERVNVIESQVTTIGTNQKSVITGLNQLIGRFDQHLDVGEPPAPKRRRGPAV